MFNFNKKKKESTPQDIQEIIYSIEELKKENAEIKEELQEIRKKDEFLLRKPEIVRFNPFPGEGGNQSFSLAIIDKKGDGIVITNLYTKEGNRVYGKPIRGGVCEYALSKEEKEAIQKALNPEI